MSEQFKTNNPELDSLFERYRAAPGSHVFAPLADACRKAGMLEEAIEICERGVSTHPRYASGFVVRGKCYYDLGNTDQAEASFEEVLRLDANNLVALKYMGLILAERGEAEGARRHFEHILELDPNDREIAEKLEALTLREATEILDDEASMRGLVDDDATNEDDSFVANDIQLGGDEPTTDVLATMTLAEIYASQGYRAKAAKIFRELVAAQPDNEVARARLRELGESREEDARPATLDTTSAPDVPQEKNAPAAASPPDARDGIPSTEAPGENAAADDPPAPTPATDKAAPAEPSDAETPEPAVEKVAAPAQPAGAHAARKPRATRASRASRKSPPTPAAGDAGVSQFKRWLDNLNR